MIKIKFIYFLVLVTLISNTATGEPISFFDLVKKNNLFYEKSSDLPFSGQVKGIQNGRLVNGRIHGLWITYLDNGNLSHKANYKNGKREGLFEVYHKNGRLYREGNYQSGKKIGLWLTYFKNGRISYKATYADGIEDGPINSYSSEDGRLLWRGFYKNGKRDGPWEYYHKNGQLSFKGNYVDGKEEGSFEHFKENGKFEKRETWKNGKVIFKK